ncbi:hypothetical protein ACJX0J_026620 [Zea mays]
MCENKRNWIQKSRNLFFEKDSKKVLKDFLIIIHFIYRTSYYIHFIATDSADQKSIFGLKIESGAAVGFRDEYYMIAAGNSLVSARLATGIELSIHSAISRAQLDALSPFNPLSKIRVALWRAHSIYDFAFMD